MKLREVTRKAIASLEEKSGYIVKITEDSALSTLATIRIARGNITAKHAREVQRVTFTVLRIRGISANRPRKGYRLRSICGIWHGACAV